MIVPESLLNLPENYRYSFESFEEATICVVNKTAIGQW